MRSPSFDCSQPDHLTSIHLHFVSRLIGHRLVLVTYCLDPVEFDHVL